MSLGCHKTCEFTESFGGQAQHVEVVSKPARDVYPEEQEDRQNPEDAGAREHSGDSESAASGAESGASLEAEQRQSGEKLQPDAGTADLDEADDFPPEPNVLVYSLSAAGGSVQQALSALVKQVNLQAWSDAKSSSTITVWLLRLDDFSLQKQSSQEQFFVAITTPLSWARTQLLSDSVSPVVQPVQQSATDSSIPDADPAQDVVGNSEHTDAAMQNAAEGTLSMTLSSADASRRTAAACARTVLEAERFILAAASKTLKTYVVCPGVLYGEFMC